MRILKWTKQFAGRGILLMAFLGVFGREIKMGPALAEEKDQQPSGQHTLYGIGSTSKVVTAAAVMKLAGEGKLSLDEPLVTYLPEFTMADVRYKQITPRMLLNHTSGLQGGTLASSMLLGDPDTKNHDSLLDNLKTQRLKADPGEFAVYCNDGFTLAEILVERVSGITFTEYLEKEMAKPLGLSDFATPFTPGILDRTAAVYDNETGGGLPPEMANVIGSGGMYASAADLCRLSQIFMRDQGRASGILSPAAAMEMEKSTCKAPSLPFGLGWDSVDTYPFSRYGIKALVKGGDTTYYHSSLTVLPEENISCAVVLSGGSSMGAQLAVQEILMEYLEETGRITRQSEDIMAEAKGKPAGATPEELMGYEGFYAGTEMLHVTMEEEGSLILETLGTGRDKKQVYTYHDDGRFYSTDGSYINSSGALTRGSNGRVGKTFLEWETGTNGREYLMAGIYETYPKLGSTATYLPIAERISVKAQPSREALDAWREQHEQEFYLVNEKSTSAFYLEHFMIKPRISQEPAGYLSFENMELRMARITGPEKAEFFQKVPGQVGRDLNDYWLEKRDGNIYLTNGSSRYLRQDGILPLESEEGIIIGSQGETIWRSFGKEWKNRQITIKKPEKGAWFIYDHSGSAPKCVASSLLLEERETLLLPAKGYIAFAGAPGEEFILQAEDL